jgi:hypothetical protein
VDDESELTSEPQPSETDVRIVYDGLMAFNVAHVGRKPQKISHRPCHPFFVMKCATRIYPRV